MLVNMSKSKTPIAYKILLSRQKFKCVPFSISQPVGVKTTITVGVAKTKSIDFFMTECVDKLRHVKRASTAPCDGPRHFAELESCLAGWPLEACQKVKQEYFPDPADETEAKFHDCVQLICVDLYDQPRPGDHLKLYIQITRVKHALCFGKDGFRTRYDNVYSQLLRMLRIGDKLSHNSAGNSLFTGE